MGFNAGTGVWYATDMMNLLGMSCARSLSFIAAAPSTYVATGMKHGLAQLDVSVCRRTLCDFAGCYLAYTGL